MRYATIGLLALWAAAPAGAADSLRCGSRIVATGASAAEVIATCGEPAFRDDWLYPQGHRYISDVEQWYYNFGSNQLLRILRLDQGQLTDIDSDGYGWNEPPAGRCGSAEIAEGMSKYRLLLRCGEPLTREAFNVLRPLRTRDGRLHPRERVPMYREEWTYNFGPDQMMRKVTLEDGRVSDVDTVSSRGFSRP